MIETAKERERVILVGVSLSDPKDARRSLEELEELAATAGGRNRRICDTEPGADAPGYLRWKRKDRGDPGFFVGTGGNGDHL